MRFAVLGTVRTEPVAHLPPRERTILATLLLNAGQIVSVRTLATAVWDDDDPSPAARNTIQGQVKRLRQGLGPAAERILTRPPGYLIEVRPGELDLHEFTRLRDQAAIAAHDGAWEQVSELLTEALALWRDDPLSDVTSAYLRRTKLPRLTELRHEALEARIDADLHLGRHEILTAELRTLVAGNPYRERLWEQLMLALYRSGRQNDALDAYDEARRKLRAKLGIDPSPRLTELHRHILNADPVLSPPPDRTQPDPPRQLPAGLSDFTGRTDESGRLLDLLVPRPGTVPLAVISGPGGIGKTMLAIHLAHQAAGRFPDGQIFVELGGATNPVRGHDVLGRLLRDLGVPDREIPEQEDERAARYRTVAAGRKLLIVLDDAPDAARVRAALPGTGGSAVIVTSRSSLAGLAGADFFELSSLNAVDSHALLTSIVGTSRTANDPPGADDIIASCAGLPLAIRIAGSRLATSPGWTASQLGRLIADEQRRLSMLAAGNTAVRASFEVSYLALPEGDPSPARIFRLFGLAGLTGLGLPAVAALAGVSPARTAGAVTALVDAHLLESPAPDRYQAHDLLRLYAAERALDDEPAAARQEALRQMFIWYLHSLNEAVSEFGRIHRVEALSGVPAPAVPVPEFCSLSDKLSWLRDERANLIRLVELASAHGFDDLCWRLAATVRHYFEWTGHFADQIAVGSIGLAAAERSGDCKSTAMLSNVLGSASWKLGRLARAVEYYTRALELRRELGDSRGVAALLANLGLVELDSGESASAVERLTDALAINRETQSVYGEAFCLHNLGYAHQLAGRAEEALAHYEQALAIRRVHCPLDDQAGTMHSIGELLLTMGRTHEAMGYLRECQKICHDNDLSYGEGMTLTSLGDGYRALGLIAEATQAWEDAHRILSGLGATEDAKVRERLTSGPAGS